MLSLSTGTKCLFIFLLATSFACKTSQTGNASPSTSNAAATPAVKANDDGTVPSGTGVEKEKPAPDKANVQGKALFNGKPASGIEVKLCQKFNRFMGGCTGEAFTTKTDAAGEYFFKDVPPGVYEGLTVRVFESKYFVFATSGIITAAKYNLTAGATYFAPDTNLFKSDLKVLSPKAAAKVEPDGIALKWDAYADAAYYKIGVYADSASGAETNYDYINKRVDDTSFTLDKPLKPGSYSLKVQAFNADDIKLAECADDIKFTVNGAAAAK